MSSLLKRKNTDLINDLVTFKKIKTEYFNIFNTLVENLLDHILNFINDIKCFSELRKTCKFFRNLLSKRWIQYISIKKFDDYIENDIKKGIAVQPQILYIINTDELNQDNFDYTKISYFQCLKTLFIDSWILSFFHNIPNTLEELIIPYFSFECFFLIQKILFDSNVSKLTFYIKLSHFISIQKKFSEGIQLISDWIINSTFKKNVNENSFLIGFKYQMDGKTRYYNYFTLPLYYDIMYDEVTHYKENCFTRFCEKPLIIVIKNNNLNFLKELLLSKKFDVNEATPEGKTPLYFASKYGYSVMVKLLLENGAIYTEAIKNSDYSPLHEACRNEDLETVKLLTNSGFDVNHICNGETPLYITSLKANLPLMKLLFVKNVNVNDKFYSKKFFTPLTLAIHKKRDDVVEYLLQQGSDPNQQQSEGKSPLFSACSLENTEKIIELLIKFGAEISNDVLFYSTQYQCNTLTLACRKGRIDIVKLLMKKKINIHDMVIPLIEACTNQHFEIVELLISKNVFLEREDLNYPRKINGKSVFHFILESLDYDLIHKFLLMGGDPCVPDHSCNVTPINFFAQHSAEEKYFLIFKLLIKFCSNLNQICHFKGETLLISAIKGGSLQGVKWLCNSGVDINLQEDIDGHTPLYRACVLENFEIANFLISKKADPNIIAYDGSSPLTISVKNGSIEIVKLLIANNANIFIYNNGKTIFNNTPKKNYQEIYSLLRKKYLYCDEQGL
jgi:ankyrin repeat protein